MVVHLLKLCVGAQSIDDLQAWQAGNMAHWPDGFPRHITRMTPKREADLLAGGSLYWIIKGAVQCRQRIVALKPLTDEAGVARCAIALAPEIVPTQAAPRRPFQGWRYLDPEDAPADLYQRGREAESLPSDLAERLALLGLL